MPDGNTPPPAGLKTLPPTHELLTPSSATCVTSLPSIEQFTNETALASLNKASASTPYALPQQWRLVISIPVACGGRWTPCEPLENEVTLTHWLSCGPPKRIPAPPLSCALMLLHRLSTLSGSAVPPPSQSQRTPPL